MGASPLDCQHGQGQGGCRDSQKCTQEGREVKCTCCEVLIQDLIEAKHVLVDLGFGFRLFGWFFYSEGVQTLELLRRAAQESPSSETLNLGWRRPEQLTMRTGFKWEIDLDGL